MAVESNADRSLFARDFGSDLTITPPGGGPALEVDDGDGSPLRPPRGIPENAFEGVDIDDESEIQSTNPQVIVPSWEIPGVERGWDCLYEAVQYRIEEAKPDGTGMTYLVLSLSVIP